MPTRVAICAIDLRLATCNCEMEMHILLIRSMCRLPMRFYPKESLQTMLDVFSDSSFCHTRNRSANATLHNDTFDSRVNGFFRGIHTRGMYGR